LGGAVSSADEDPLDKLANTIEKTKFDEMAARRNSHLKQQGMSTAFSDRGDSSDRKPQHHDQHPPQLYSSISTEKVQEIDYSDYGF
jgi:hypothetical protein